MRSSMLIDRSARIWAMRPDEVVAQQAMAMRDQRDVQSAIGGQRLEGSDFARVIDGVAVIPVYGLLMRRWNWMFWSYEEVARDVALAQADRTVSGIVLDVDSGGGMAAGCGDLSEAIRAAGPKPIRAFVGGMCASAAYYLASAARDITVGSGAILGSIGTVIEYVDLEPYFEKLGARIVRVVAEQSPNKRLDPASPEGKAEMQALVNAGAAAFIADIARNRGVTEDEVLAEFGQGLVFDGDDAIRRGMADRRGTLSQLVAELAGRDPTAAAVPAAAAQEHPMDWANLTTALLRQHRADLVTEIETAATVAATAGADTRAAEAATAERDRILAIEEVAVAGHEDLVAAAKKDGKTTASELALSILKAEKAAGGAMLAGLKAADAAAAVPPVPPRQTTTVAAGATAEEQAKAAWDKDPDIRAEFGDFETYAAYAKAADAGTARILKRAL